MWWGPHRDHHGQPPVGREALWPQFQPPDGLCCGRADRLAEYFRIDWLSRSWNLVFVAGTIAGGAVARYLLLGDHAVALNPGTVEGLQSMGITDAGAAFAPAALFSSEAWTHPVAIAMLLVGGMLVGLGTRWANGCTSGHAISGLSAMQWPSLIAVIGFFIGGFSVSHFVLPSLLPLLS